MSTDEQLPAAGVDSSTSSPTGGQVAELPAEQSAANRERPQSVIEHRSAERRFVLSQNGAELAHLEYVLRDGVWFFTHTFTEPAARGQGLAAEVVKAGLDGARAAGVLVRPVCPFVTDYLAAHAEYRDLLGAPRSS